ncbi:MAG: tetratricopeptide repeat protein [Candidatus Thorarchaeota archaeon]|jgi:tetratricopeptide (TPR) repeat protein
MAAAPDEMTQYDWFAQARIHEVADEYDSALRAFDKALEIDPNFGAKTGVGEAYQEVSA